MLSSVWLFVTPWTMHSPWNSLGQNIEVGSPSLLQKIFPTQGSNRGLLHRRWILYQLSYQGSPCPTGLSVPLNLIPHPTSGPLHLTFLLPRFCLPCISCFIQVSAPRLHVSRGPPWISKELFHRLPASLSNQSELILPIALEQVFLLLDLCEVLGARERGWCDQDGQGEQWRTT